MIINHLFAVPIVFFEIPENIIQKTLKIANNHIEKNNWKTIRPVGETFTTFYDDKNFLGKNNCVDLLNTINENVRCFLQLIGKDSNANLKIENWLNYNPYGTGHEMHEHFNSIASGVIYLDADENSGNLVFHDPITLRTQSNSINSIKETNDYNRFTYGLKPQTNRMVIFEGWVYHSVEPNKTDNNRISIAFNTGFING